MTIINLFYLINVCAYLYKQAYDFESKNRVQEKWGKWTQRNWYPSSVMHLRGCPLWKILIIGKV